MDYAQNDSMFLLKLFQFVPPSHLALFLRLVRLYPTNIVNDTARREDTILEIVNETLSTKYNASLWPQVLAINRIPQLANQIFINDEKSLLIEAIDRLQNRFELQPHRFKMHQLLPVNKACSICNNSLGEPKFDEVCNIIGRSDIYTGVTYKNECCDMIYTYGYARNRRTRERFISPDAIYKQEFVHLFTHVIVERLMLVSFTNLVQQAASNFESFTNATNADIEQNRKFKNKIPTENKINSKEFGTTWLWFEICRYLFFMTNLQTIQIPDVIQRLSHNMYFEANFDFFYEAFVKFWSRHNQVKQCQCNSRARCMRNFVFDTHMKAHRLVCAFTSSCDESIPEMGPVAIGCPRTPLRISSKLFNNLSSEDKNRCKHFCVNHFENALRSELIQEPTAKQASELDRVSDLFEGSDMCTVHRDDDDHDNKRRTAGFMAIVSNCNIIIGWNESVRSEGMRRNAYYLLKYLRFGGILPPAAAYDSACTFVRFLKGQHGVSLMPSIYVEELLQKKYCIDRFHRRNHTRPECKTILSCSHPNNKPFFDNENTQVCEQLFAHFSKLQTTLRSLAWPYSAIFYCIIFHLRNCFHARLFPDNQHLAVTSDIPSNTIKLIQWTQVMASVDYEVHESDDNSWNESTHDLEENFNECR